MEQEHQEGREAMEKTLARRLRIERAARGLSLTEAAEKIGIRRDTLSELERGKRGAYSGTLEKIADAYDLSLGELLSEETTVAPKADAPTPSSGPVIEQYIRDPHDPRPYDEAIAEAYEEVVRLGVEPGTRVVLIERMMAGAWEDGFKAGRQSAQREADREGAR
jgi:transcriptional regulator with XRE-family HTH domain